MDARPSVRPQPGVCSPPGQPVGAPARHAGGPNAETVERFDEREFMRDVERRLGEDPSEELLERLRQDAADRGPDLAPADGDVEARPAEQDEQVADRSRIAAAADRDAERMRERVHDRPAPEIDAPAPEL